MIPLYHETRALRETVEKLLADVSLEPTASRREFGPLLANADVGIIGLGRGSGRPPGRRDHRDRTLA